MHLAFLLFLCVAAVIASPCDTLNTVDDPDDFILAQLGCWRHQIMIAPRLSCLYESCDPACKNQMWREVSDRLAFAYRARVFINLLDKMFAPVPEDAIVAVGTLRAVADSVDSMERELTEIGRRLNECSSQ